MQFFSAIVFGNDILTTVIGLSANALVIVLCFKAEFADNMKERVFIAWRASADFAMATVFTALQLGLRVNQSYATVLIYGPATHCPILALQCICTLLLFLFDLDLVSLPIAILYRYSIICGRPWIKRLFTKYTLPLTVFTLAAIALAFGAMIQSFFTYEKSKFIGGPLEFMGVPVMVQLPDHAFEPAVVYIVFLIVSTVISYTIMTFAARRIFMKLQSASLSPQTKKLQKEITICMVLQALLPLVFSTIPMIALITLVVAPAAIDFYGTIILSILNWQPCVYPMIALLSIRPFRRYITGLFKQHTTFVVPFKTPTSTTFTRRTAKPKPVAGGQAKTVTRHSSAHQ